MRYSLELESRGYVGCKEKRGIKDDFDLELNMHGNVIIAVPIITT